MLAFVRMSAPRPVPYMIGDFTLLYCTVAFKRWPWVASDDYICDAHPRPVDLLEEVGGPSRGSVRRCFGIFGGEGLL